MSSPKDQTGPLKGLKKFLEEAKEILKFNGTGEDETIERVDDVLKKLDPIIQLTEAGAELDENLIEELASILPAGTVAPRSGWNKKPLVSGKAPVTPNAPERPKRQEVFRQTEEMARKASAPPAAAVAAIQEWVREKWKTPVYWDSLDAIEQTWHLQALVRSMFKAGKIARSVEFVKGNSWGTEIFGEQKKMSMGAPSIVWCIHETLHLLLEEEDEQIVWTATVRLINDVFADINPEYGQERLEAEFDERPVYTTPPASSVPKPKNGWAAED